MQRILYNTQTRGKYRALAVLLEDETPSRPQNLCAGSGFPLPPVASRCLPLLLVASSCLPLLPVASRCLPLPPAASRCLPLPPARLPPVAALPPLPPVASRAPPLFPVVPPLACLFGSSVSFSFAAKVFSWVFINAVYQPCLGSLAGIIFMCT